MTIQTRKLEQLEKRLQAWRNEYRTNQHGFKHMARKTIHELEAMVIAERQRIIEYEEQT